MISVGVGTCRPWYGYVIGKPRSNVGLQAEDIEVEVIRIVGRAKRTGGTVRWLV